MGRDEEAAQMSERWTIKGRIVVDHLLPELSEMRGSRSALPGIGVKVSARSKIPLGWGTWNAWDTVTTGADGRFQVTKDKGSDRRQFKIEILFDSSRLRIKEGKETAFSLDAHGFPVDVDLDLTDKDWHDIFSDKDDDTDRKAGVHDLGDVAVAPTVVRKHADAWLLYNAVMDLLASFGPAFAFTRKVVLKYPASLSAPGWSSYANPFNDHIYIKDDQFNAYTITHELMHRVEYDHCTGETAMAWQLAKHGDTHQTRENTSYVPFLESFADFAAVKVLQAISGGTIKNFADGFPYARPDQPFSRAFIGGALGEQERNLANLDYTERGWYGLFAVLTFPFLDRVDVDRFFTGTEGEDTRYAFVSLFSDLTDLRLGFTFKDVLTIFLPRPSQNIDAVLSTQEMNFRDFLERAGKILPGLDASRIRAVKSLLNPAARAAPATAV
jgi:hypothetical protein